MRKAASLRIGDPQQVGAYRLTGLLGEGGQGSVYRGEAPDGGPVAVKLLHARFGGDAKARARFAAELSHAERVAPFCTARVLDADLEGDRPYIVSEFVAGPSLAEMIATDGPPGGSALDRIAIATVTALAAIHEAGIVHRDFKPNNVIMGTDGPRVIDFGIARALDASTLSSGIVGTPSYMAPEQIGGGVIGPAVDIFAWGCTMAYAASGVTPFGEDSIPVVMHRILHEEPDLHGLTGPLRDIVTACLAKDPTHRPAARQILLRLLGGEEPAKESPTLLDQGARASALPPTTPFPPGAGPHPPAQAAAPHWSAGPGAIPPGPYGQPAGPGMPGPFGPGMGPGAAPGGPWHRPPSPGRASRLKIRRTVTRVTALLSLLLGVCTPLTWAHAGIATLTASGPAQSPALNPGVSGLLTPWGVLTLVMAIAAIAVAVADEFGPRVSAAWTAVPGGVAVASVVGFIVRKADLHSKNPVFGKLSESEIRQQGYILHITLEPTVYLALAAAVAVVTLALISLAFREPSGRAQVAVG